MRGVKSKLLRGIAAGYSKIPTSYVGQIQNVVVENPLYLKDGDLRPTLAVERLQVHLHPQCTRRVYQKIKRRSPPRMILGLTAETFHRRARANRPQIQVFDTKAEALAAQAADRR